MSNFTLTQSDDGTIKISFADPWQTTFTLKAKGRDLEISGSFESCEEDFSDPILVIRPISRNVVELQVD